MIYLVQQIVLCLLFTAAIAAAVGWLLRGLGTARQTDAVASHWRTRVASLEQQLGLARRQAAEGAKTQQPEERADTVANVELDALQAQLAERESEIARLRTAQSIRAQSALPSEALKNELQELKIAHQQLREQVATDNPDGLQQQLRTAMDERSQLVDRLRATEVEMAELRRDKQHAVDTIAGLQRDLRASKSELARLTAATEAPTTAPRAVQEERSRAVPGPSPGPSEPERAAQRAADAMARRGAPAAEPVPRQQTLAMADTAPPKQAAYKPTWRLAAPDGRPDNLQAIYGIGPKLEHRLNGMGIFHYRQIAGFQKQDIVWVAQHLRSFPGRILRDRWVEQARSLEKRRQAGQPV